MSATSDYPDLFTYRKRSILPKHTQKAVYDLGLGIQKILPDTTTIPAYRTSLQNMPASSLPRASAEIREIAGIYNGYQPHHSTNLISKFFRVLKGHPDNLSALLKSTPDLGWLLLFHGNGYLRQAALENLAADPLSEFEFSAVVYRLNDWVENVRLAATKYAARHFPSTNPEVIGKSSFFLLTQARHLSRWNKEGQAVLEEAIYRADVLIFLREQFSKVRSGRVGHTLQQLLRRPDFDPHLHYLACNAALPLVRAISMDVLLNERARWFVSYRKEWVDKVYGISRRIAEFDYRPIDTAVDFQTLVQIAASDRSAQVRKVAADSLIAKRQEASDLLDKIARKLQSDKNRSVRTRIDYYLRKRD